MSNRDENLAYGSDYGQNQGSEYQGADRGLVSDTFRFLKDKYQSSQQPQNSGYGYGETWSGTNPTYSQHQGGSGGAYSGYGNNPNAPPANQPSYPGGPSQGYSGQQQKPDTITNIFHKLEGAVQGIGADLAGRLGGHYEPQLSNVQHGGEGGYSASSGTRNQFDSFASQKNGNDVKWYVDGCSYMYAVSKALEGARESIWILDWWLSPELYLRRPPSKNERYRLDRMLQAAAQRGVRVNIIVYKEVTQALTRKYLSPTIPAYLHSLLPRSTDAITSALVRMGLMATTSAMEYLEAENPLITPPLTVSSSHTKHALEDLSPNIAVLRHPDHLPDAQTVQSSLVSALQNLKLDAATAARMGGDALKSLYGVSDDVILYWAHHEKLCLVDGKIAFMGGLDLCFGRWDTNQHPIADCHPGDLRAIVFPGQDYNNARIMDFQDVAHPDQNKLDRKTSSRMGWSDISVSLQGPCVQDLRRHFVDRWNFIYEEKYNVRKDVRYSRLSLTGGATGGLPNTVPGAQQSGDHHGGYQQSYSQSQANTGYSQSNVSQSSGEDPNLRPSSVYGQSGPQYPPPGSNTSPQWHSTSRPHSPQPPFQQQQQQQSSYGDSQQAYHYPPPPPGGPASTYSSQSTQLGGSQHASHYGYDPSPHSQQEGAAELEGSEHSQRYPYDSASQSTQGYSSTATHQARGIGGEWEDSEGQEENERGLGGRFTQYGNEGRRLKDELSGVGNMLYGHVEDRMQNVQGKLLGGTDRYGRPLAQPRGVMPCQIVRSCTKWSNGTPTEHSVQNAYIGIIQNSQHFIYIENQFFITATGNSQSPVKNQIGKALVDRIVRAARAGEKYKVIVLIPSVPGFAGDLRDDSSLGTRAIMEFQYNSINRGGHSIMEMISKEGINPMDYIRFYNLRNYDRINASGIMQRAEKQSGVDYEEARKEHDDIVGAGFGGYGEGTRASTYNSSAGYQQYQQAAQQIQTSRPAAMGKGRWDTVSECYMLGGEDIRNVPWESPGDLSEIDAFVSEELYIHTKVLIADDRVVICGSANLNDRSQLGTHDSEIAIIVEDPTPVESTMGGRPWQASRFAASLRRQLFRKHLGLLRPQDMERPDANFEPVGVPNNYDWGSPEDNVVADPLSDTFQSLWNSRARQNTDVFRKVFRAVPDDTVRTWEDYKEFYEYFFHDADAEADGKEGKKKPARYMWGHIVRDDFQPGAEGLREVKDLLSRVKGSLVEMPLMFLIEEDIAKEGLSLNPLTEEVYT